MVVVSAEEPADGKTELVNNTVMAMYTDIGEDNARKLQQIMYMHLSRCVIEKKTTEVGFYQRDVTAEVISRFLIEKKLMGGSDRTVHYYKSVLDKVFDEIGKSPMDVDTDDLRVWLAKRQFKDKVSAVTADNERRVISSLFTWMSQQEIRTHNPTLRIDSIKARKEKKKAFTELEVEKMRDYLKNRSDKEKLIFELLLSTWARVSEIAQIRLDEIKGNDILVHGKGDKDRNVYMNARTVVAMKNYLESRGKDDSPYLFPRNQHWHKKKNGGWESSSQGMIGDGHMDLASIEGVVRNIGRATGVHAHPHKFRRTGATMALRRGMPLEQVSRILGHENLDTTKIYLDLDDEDIKKAHKKYSM